ncbi:unnamed protein product [Closterium sp. NIES-53]
MVLRYPTPTKFQEPGGVPAGGTSGTQGAAGGGSSSRSAGAGGMGTGMPTPRTVRFLTRVQHLDRLEREERERFERARQQQQQQVQSQPQQGQVLLQQTPEEAEQLRRRDQPDPAPARFVHGPLPSPPVPPVESLSSFPWTRPSPLSHVVSPEPRRSRYRADGPFHLVLRSRVPPPSILPQPPESSLIVFPDPLSDYLRASRPVPSATTSCTPWTFRSRSFRGACTSRSGCVARLASLALSLMGPSGSCDDRSMACAKLYASGTTHFTRPLQRLTSFRRLPTQSLFVCRGSTPFFVLVYVDDLIFATPDKRTLASVKEELQRRHTCTDLGELQHYIGPQITRDRAAHICVLAGFDAPGRHQPSHWYATKRVAKYVASTSGMGLVLGGKQPVTLTGYSDSSWVDDAETCRSTQGSVARLASFVWSLRPTLHISSSRRCRLVTTSVFAPSLTLCRPVLTCLRRDAEPGGADNGGDGLGGSELGGAESGGAGSGGAESPSGGGVRVAPAGVPAAGGAGGSGAGGTGAGGTGAGGAGGYGAGGTGAGGAGDSGAGGIGGAGSGGAVQPLQRRQFFWEQPDSSLPPPGSAFHQVLHLPSASAEQSAVGTTPPLLVPPPDKSQTQLPPDSPLPAPSRFTPFIDPLIEHREHASRPALPVGRTCCAPCYVMLSFAFTSVCLPSYVRVLHAWCELPQRFVLSLPPASSLLDVPDPESDLARVASPSDTRCLATLVSDPTFEFAVASALVTELVDFASTCHLDYFASLVAKSDCPPFVGGELALGCDVLEDRLFQLECLGAAVPHLVAMMLALEGDPDALDIPSPCSYALAIMGQYSS